MPDTDGICGLGGSAGSAPACVVCEELAIGAALDVLAALPLFDELAFPAIRTMTRMAAAARISPTMIFVESAER